MRPASTAPILRPVAIAAALVASAGCAGAPAADAAPATAVVEIECRAALRGRLEDCRILREEPAGMGFGEAALRSARRQSVDSTTPVGETVRFAYSYRPAD